MDYQNTGKQNKKGIQLQSVYNLIMGVLWTAVGLFIFFHTQLGYTRLGRLDDDPVLTSIFGGAAVLYGLFRLYRGLKKGR